MSSIALSTAPLPLRTHAHRSPPPFSNVYPAPPDAPPPPTPRRQDTAVLTPAPFCFVEPAAESLFHVIVDLSDSPDLVASHTWAFQCLQVKIPYSKKLSFLAIASPPSLAAGKGVLDH